MAPPLPLDDKRTLQAIGILADALDDVSGAGVLDTVTTVLACQTQH